MTNNNKQKLKPNSNYQTTINTLILNILNTNLKCSNLFDVCKGLNILFDWSVWVCFIQNTQVLKNAKWLFQLSALLTFEMHQVFSHVYSMFCRSFTRTLIQLINNSRQTKTEYFKRATNYFRFKSYFWSKIVYVRNIVVSLQYTD